MACSKKLRDIITTLVATSTTTAFQPLTEWMPSTGIESVKFALWLLSLDGDADAEVIPCVQLADVRPDDPNGPSAISGTWVDTAGVHPFSETISASGKFFIRFGVAYRLKTGESGMANIQAKLSAAVQRCGKVLPGKEIDVAPYMTVNTASYFPISGWEPTVGLSKLKAAFVVMDNDNTDLEYVLVARTCNDPAKPSSWSVVEAGWNNPTSGNTTRNTDEVNPPSSASTAHLIQLGVGVRAKTGGTNPRAIVRVVGALKY